MIAEIRKAKADFYNRTGRFPARLFIHPDAYFDVICEMACSMSACKAVSFDLDSEESTICDMLVEQVPELNVPFEVSA